ncbi:TPA: hypothetical protein I7766_19300 [Vibrio vulnificus]|nr:hypothetical protein [Vibrio vulnificus]
MNTQIIAPELSSEHLLYVNSAILDVVITTKPNMSVDNDKCRVVGLKTGNDNLFEIVKFYADAGYASITLAVDSVGFPEDAARVMLDNFYTFQVPTLDVSTNTVYRVAENAFGYLWSAFRVSPLTEIANALAGYLIQKIPLQYENETECVNAYLSPTCKGYNEILGALKSLMSHHYQQLEKSVSLSAYHHFTEVTSFDNVQEMLDTSKVGTYVLIGGTGTYKTKKGLQPLASSAHSHKKVVYISYLVALVEQFCHASNASFYKTVSLPDLEQSPALGLVVNSAIKAHLAAYLLECDVLLIDEFEKVISTISTIDESVLPRYEVMVLLEKAIKRVPKLVVADADVSDITLKWLGGLRSEVHVIKNNHNPYRNITAVVQDKIGYFAELSANLKADKVILCDSLNVIKTLLIELGCTKNGYPCEEKALKQGILVIHSKNKGLPKQRKLLEDPTTEVMKYHKIIASPCLGSGFSIESDFTDEVNVISELTLAPYELINFGRRFRACNNIRFLVTQNRIYDTHHRMSTIETNSCDRLRHAFETRKALFNQNQALSMYWSLLRSGFKTQIIQSSDSITTLGFKHFKQLRRLTKESRAIAIFKAEKGISTSEIKQLQYTHCVTFTDEARIRRFEIESEYPQHLFSVELIRFDEGFTNKPLFQSLFCPQLACEYEKKHLQLIQLLNKYLLNLGALDHSSITITRQEVYAFAKAVYVIKNELPSEIRSMLSKPMDTPNKATSFFKKLLGSIGLKISSYNGSQKRATVTIHKFAQAYRQQLL